MSSNVKDVIYSVYRIRMSDYRIISADENFEKLTGYTEKDYRENQLKHTDLIPAEDIVEYIEKMMQIRRNQNENIQEHRLVKKNGDIIVVFCYGKIYKDEKTGEVQAQIIVSDVTDTAPLSQVKTESSSYMEISEHDMLTGLYNRGSFEKRVNHDLALLNDGNCAIIVMDIRELKWINDTYGRSAGDMAINNMAANMVSIFRSDVVMSRIGGDEFCLYIPLYEEKMQQQYMDKIMQVAEQTTITGYPDVRIKVTVGTAVSSRFGTDFWQLYSSAETALKQAKEKGMTGVSVQADNPVYKEAYTESILVVMANDGIQHMVGDIFMGKYKIIKADTSQEAIEIVDEKKDSLCLVLTEMYANGINGFDLLDYMRKMDYIDNVPVVFLSGEYIEDVYKNAFAHGVIDIVTSPIDTYSFSSRLNNIIDLYKHKNALEEKTMRQTRKIQRLNEKIIESLGNVVEFRDVESGAHIKRVKFFTKILAECAKEECPEYGLTQNDIDMIVQASPLHDVGKISISDTILLKPGKLTPEEFEIMKTHTTKGYDIILRIFNDEGEEEYMQYCSQIARYHHEKYDGGGYPEGLTGDEIPIGAQLVSLADVYDALISKRCYKPSFSYDTAYQMILDGECGIFNPRLLQCFIKKKNELEAMAEQFKD